MHYNENDRRRDPTDRRYAAYQRWGMGSIILASLAALAVVFALFYGMSNNNDMTATSTASNTRPAATTGTSTPTLNRDAVGTSPINPSQSTTGSGSSLPSTPPATNR